MKTKEIFGIAKAPIIDMDALVAEGVDAVLERVTSNPAKEQAVPIPCITVAQYNALCAGTHIYIAGCIMPRTEAIKIFKHTYGHQKNKLVCGV